MNAMDVARQKYVQLMAQVEDLEEQVEALHKQPATPGQAEALRALQEKLGAARTELTRLSDGCGVPHAR
jgi:cell division septum initiation protein DivIVA